MMAKITDPPVLPATALIEAKALLRLETVQEEALLAAQLRTALTLAEDFTGTVWLETGFQERRAVRREIILTRRPVQELTGARIIYANGSETALPGSTLTMQRTDHGEALVGLPESMLDGRDILVDYRAGRAAEWTGLPDALRMGVLRMAAHLFTYRDDALAAGVPHAVAALWRPYKQLRLM